MNTEILNIAVTVYKLQLKLKRNCTFPFYHGMQVYSLCCNLFDKHPLGLDVLLYPAESGFINYHQNDLYNFGLTLLGSNPINIPDLKSSLEEIFKEAIPLGKNAENGDISSFFSLSEISEIEVIKSLPENLSDEIELRFLTPLRHSRRKKEKGKSFFDPSYFDAGYFLERLYYRAKDLAAYFNIKLQINTAPQIPACRIIYKNLMWVDVPSQNETLGGVIGSVKFSAELDGFWPNLLWLGQYIHAGRNSSFGFGKYYIESCPVKIPVVHPVENFLQRSAGLANIKEAYGLIHKTTAVSNNFKEEEFEKDIENNIRILSTNTLQSKYVPSHLIGCNVPKKSGGTRALAVPEFRDRLLQKAVNNIIMPSIDRLLEDSSFAYRKGISRISAAKTILKATQNGFKFAVKTDIESFFDNVDWNILFSKLDVLFHNDPLLKILEEWVRQPVFFDGRVIIRDRGLPQGAVISPALANLYLDEFDELLEENFKLVRYADDILILCRSKAEIENAIEAARNALEKLHLELNKGKTKIENFDHGFQYLGFLFNKSTYENLQGKIETVLQGSAQLNNEVKTKKPEIEVVHEDDKKLFAGKIEIPGDAFNKNWLMQIEPNEIKPAGQIKKSYKPQINKIAGSRLPGICGDAKRNNFPLYVNGATHAVRFEGDTLVIKDTENPKGEERKFPFEQILSLVFMGTVKISFAAVVKLNLNRIPVYFTNFNGKLYLSIPFEPKNYKYWLRQQSLAENEEFSLEFAKKIVAAKIHNCVSLLSKKEQDGNGISGQLNSFIEAAKGCTSIDVLRGIEGKASAVYFEAYGKLLQAEWKFDGRVKHPPKDPINCMLSICYMVLFNHIATALQIAGLNPDIGFYHISRGRYPALASDLVEEFRFIAESRILYIINRNIIKPADFTFNVDGKYPCSMNNDARIKLIRQMEQRLNETFIPPGSEEAITYFNYFYLKANSILDLLKDRIEQYQPLLTK
jgi:CRISPR-associated protein Cas1